MDIMFLLKAGEQLQDMKTFVKAFINSADIGICFSSRPFDFYFSLLYFSALILPIDNVSRD